jgi:cystathionine beta-synthase
MTKFLNDDWMKERGFMDDDDTTGPYARLASKFVSDLALPTPITVLPTVTCEEAARVLASQGIDQMPVVTANSEIVGMLTEGNLASQLLSKRALPTDPVSKVVFRQFSEVTLSTPLSKLSKIFEKNHFALVVQTQRSFSGSTFEEKKLVCSVVTRIDLLNYVLKDAGGLTRVGSAGNLAGSV